MGLLALALAGVLWFDLTTGGDAEPAPLMGAVGTPVRGTFVAPTRPPPGQTPTPRPRPTVAGATGTPEERDEKRRNDLIILLGAFNTLRDEEGEYPGTGGNVQTLCAFRELDAGCAVREVLGEEPPQDPLDNPIEYGYWYQSDGDTVRIYASLEGEVPEEQRCETEDANIADKPNLICVEGP